jgi:cellulose synthase/poly-beta-1,6-N-acetylglucosamine synthase-like glycosyltransferase
MTILSLTSYAAVFLSLYFGIFFLLSYAGKKSPIQGKDYKTGPFTPPVSIIIPCFNEEKSVVKTIHSILSLDYPPNALQIIFVDDGSTDKTFEVVEAAFKNHPQIELYRKENGGKFTALNFGLEKVKHEFVGSLDADSFVTPKSLQYLMDKFRDPSVMATVPSTVIHEPKTIVQRAQRAEYTFSNFIRQSLSAINSVYVTPGPFSFFRKAVFEKIGNYRHAYHTEDMEMAMRMQQHGLKIAHAERAVIYTLGPSSVKKLYKQRVRWASGFIGNLKDYRSMFFKPRHGDLSLIVLPFLTIGTVTMIFFGSMTLWELITSVYNLVERINITGFASIDWNVFHWIYSHVNTLTILGSFVIFYSIIGLAIGSKLTTGKARFHPEFFYMVFIYSIMYPLWLTKGAYNTLLAKTAPWR